MNYKNLIKTAFLCFSIFLVVSCSKDNDDEVTTAETYNTTVSVTDAPIDNANVHGAFVTITNVKVNGKALEGFQTTTVDLLALQNGKVQALGDIDLESGATSSIVIELDNEVDAQGEAPGNYILTAAGEKKALLAETTEIVLNKTAEIEPTTGNELVLDFDLRKLIVLEGEANDSFSFVSEAEMSNSIRAVNKMNAGIITGTVNDTNDTAETVLVYAYEKGTYTESEADANASGGVRFANAVNSSVVNKTDGSYELHFIEEGEYELHYAAYTENAEGKLEFQGMLDADAALDLAIDILGFNVNAGGTVKANVVINGMKG